MTARHRLPLRGGTLVIDHVGGQDDETVGYLHGFVGNPWRGGPHPFLTALAGGEDDSVRRRVIAPSLPGFTGSTPCADLRSMHDWVAITSEIIDLAGLGGRPMVASSIGAMLALEVAAIRPEAFSSLTLISPLGLWDDADPVADPFGRTLSDQRAMLTANPTATAWFFDDDPADNAADLLEHGIDRYTGRTAAASLIWPIPDFGLTTRIHRVTCPVTLVWGAADRLNPPSYLARYAAALPNVTATHLIAAAGHLADWDTPTEVAAAH